MLNYIVIDLEMTGLHPKEHEILEVGAARIREKKVVETMSFFVKPQSQIPEEITQLTGITEDMAANGVSQQEALHRTVEFCGTDIWVGHNVIFDYSFLKQLAVNEKVTFEKKAVDTLKLARVLLSQPVKKTLDSLCQYFEIGRENKHRALDDAMATAKLYEILEEKYYEFHKGIFKPQQLIYNPKMQQPASKVQRMHLVELIEYHGIILDMPIDTLTRNEASRVTDRIIAQYGRIGIKM